MSVSYRYYRFKNFSGLSGYLEISEVQIVNSGARLSGATLTSSSSPISGALSDLNDNDLFTRCYWDSTVAQDAAFWLVLDYGSPVTATGYKLGGFDTAGRYPSGVHVEGSNDNSNWKVLSQASGLAYPGAHTLSSEIPLIYPWAISGNITENTDIVDWRIVAYKCKDGSLSGTALSSGTTYSVACADADPCNVLLTPKIDYVWSANKSVVVNDYVVASNPDTTPHLWKATEVGDPYYSNVSLLLHCDGTNGSTTFTDSSPSPKTVTANGNAQISTAQSKFGGASGAFDGTGDYLSANHADFAFGTGNFTIEAWVRVSAMQGFGFGSLPAGDQAETERGVNFWVTDSSGNFRVRLGRSVAGFFTDILGSGTLSAGQWYHIAVTRDSTGSNGVKLWIDGTLNAQGTSNYDLTHTQFVIGRSHTTADVEYLNGWIDDIRVTKGVARYTSNFTPPTEAFTDNKTGGTEPTWNLSGNTTDNGVTWTYVAPLIDPVSIGPKIPV